MVPGSACTLRRRGEEGLEQCLRAVGGPSGGSGPQEGFACGNDLKTSLLLPPLQCHSRLQRHVNAIEMRKGDCAGGDLSA